MSASEVTITVTLTEFEHAVRDILIDRHKGVTDNLIYVAGMNALAEEYDHEFAGKIETLRRGRRI
jgi:hypothetical protein